MVHISLADKVALITGGGTGIGRATALAFVEAGAKVMVTGRREEPLRELVKSDPEHIAWFTGDVSVREDAPRMIQAVTERFGRLDILVNNAAMSEGGDKLIDTDDEVLEKMIAVDLTGGLRLAREALKVFPKGSGQIINISSTAVNATYPGYSVYTAAKAGVEQWTRNLAAEVGSRGVRVNSVAPGATQTEGTRGIPDEVKEQLKQQTPLGRLGTPEDVARVVRLIASDEAAWVTGQVIAASGGLWL